MARWPNTELWGRVVNGLVVIRKSSWRREGEILFGVTPGGLRRLIDDEHLSDKLAVAIEDRLAAALRQHVRDQQQLLDDAAASAAAFEGDSKGRRWRIKTAHIKESNDLVDAYCADFHAEHDMERA